MYMQTNQTKQTNQTTTLQMEPVLLRICKRRRLKSFASPFQKHFDSQLYREHFNCINMHKNKQNLHMLVVRIVQCITVFVEYFKRHVEISHSKERISQCIYLQMTDFLQLMCDALRNTAEYKNFSHLVQRCQHYRLLTFFFI